MRTAELVDVHGSQAIKLPDDFRFAGDTVVIRKEGKAVVVEPVIAVDWPHGFFEEIRIDDPAFCRPEQGDTPPVQTVS